MDAAGGGRPAPRSASWDAAIAGLQLVGRPCGPLEADSELLFVGDGGTTEASRASERHGLEVGMNYWTPVSWLIVDADLAWSHARFTDADPDVPGERIPGAVEFVAALGVTLDHPSGWFGGARVRHFRLGTARRGR